MKLFQSLDLLDAFILFLKWLESGMENLPSRHLAAQS